MNIHTNVNFFLTLQAQLKIMHWQTKGYARHKALDDTFGELLDLVDTFVEEAMGKYGRFKLDEETVQSEMSNFDGTLEEFYHYIRKKYRENNKVLGDFS